MEKIKIRKFDIAQTTDRYVKMIAFYGKSKTGKSWCVRDVLRHNNINRRIIVSYGEKCEGLYSTSFPKTLVIDSFDFEHDGEKKIKKLAKYQGITKNPPRTILVFDQANRRFMRGKTMTDIYMNALNLNFLLLVAEGFHSRYPIIDSVIDFVFIFRETNTQIRKKLIFDHFGKHFESFEQFCAIMDVCTSNYMCMVIDNREKSKHLKLTDAVFWYRVDANDIK